jgi:hypothetical protein
MKDDAGVNILPTVQKVQGMTYDHPGGSDPRLGRVRLQYTDPKGEWHALGLPALDALYLLNMLEQWSKDEGLDHLRRPPGSQG